MPAAVLAAGWMQASVRWKKAVVLGRNSEAGGELRALERTHGTRVTEVASETGVAGFAYLRRPHRRDP